MLSAIFLDLRAVRATTLFLLARAVRALASHWETLAARRSIWLCREETRALRSATVVSFSVTGVGSSLAFLNLIVVPETDASRRSREINFMRTFRSASENFEPGFRGFVNSFENRSSVNIRPTLFGRCAICCSILFAES